MGVGEDILYREAAPLEVALLETDWDEFQTIRDELIKEQWDPFLVAAENLAVLAFSLGVKLWDDDWPEETKRQWLADQWEWQSKVGTAWAIARALANYGATIKDIITPPQMFFAGDEMTPEEWAAWLAKMPQIRVYLGPRHGTMDYGGFYALGQEDLDVPPLGIENFGAADVDFALDDTQGALLAGRYAVLRHHGVDTPLLVPHTELIKTERGWVRTEKYIRPGKDEWGWVADEAFADDAFVEGQTLDPEVYTVRLNGTFTSERETAWLTTLEPSFEPIEPKWKRETETGDGSLWFFADDGIPGENFAGDDEALNLIADVLYLHDPTVASLMVEGISFADYTRVDWPAYEAALLVEVPATRPEWVWTVGESFADDGFADDEDTTHLDKALRAIVAGKGLRDKVLVSFEHVRPLRVSDPIRPGTHAGDMVPNSL